MDFGNSVTYFGQDSVHNLCMTPFGRLEKQNRCDNTSILTSLPYKIKHNWFQSKLPIMSRGHRFADRNGGKYVFFHPFPKPANPGGKCNLMTYEPFMR